MSEKKIAKGDIIHQGSVRAIRVVGVPRDLGGVRLMNDSKVAQRGQQHKGVKGRRYSSHGLLALKRQQKEKTLQQNARGSRTDGAEQFWD